MIQAKTYATHMIQAKTYATHMIQERCISTPLNLGLCLQDVSHPKRIHMPHDKSFKSCLKDVMVARDFFEAHLPDKFKYYSDFSTLEISDTSYVEAAYQSNLSDVLYRVNKKDGSGHIYYLIEHVSEANPLIPFQVLRYQVSILQQHLAQLTYQGRRHAKLPEVIPIIFYRGKRSPYPYSTEGIDCFQSPELAREVLRQSIILVDLSVIPDEILKTYGSVALLELLQKHIHNGHRGKQWVSQLKEWLIEDKLHLQTPPACFENLIRYLCDFTPHEVLKEVIDIIEQTDIEPEYLNIMQTMTQYLRQEGLQQGITQEKRAVAKNMRREGLSTQTIAKVTGLRREEIERL